ncbi:unnamed protein product [Sphenostylis stenocarpa]|uniref:Uncharacterized protein n=1 Tax=Sphenostylis stenocarpa TaxID=92480 RepID=A0AA86VXB1_9FABA|nr:unnamed protein product [Sphenostylis stenocarpa]
MKYNVYNFKINFSSHGAAVAQATNAKVANAEALVAKAVVTKAANAKQWSQSSEHGAMNAEQEMERTRRSDRRAANAEVDLRGEGRKRGETKIRERRGKSEREDLENESLLPGVLGGLLDYGTVSDFFYEV